jgi:anti-sigma factor RsiW
MECSEEIRILLAGYVDGELPPAERQSVEEHLRQCSTCRRLLQEQKAAVAAYAGYPVEPAPDAQFDAMWSRLESRLPEPAKRVDLDRLAEIGAGDDYADGEPKVASESKAAAAAPPPPTPKPAAPVAQPEPQKHRWYQRTKKPVRPPTFMPLRFPRLKNTFWAHAAGIAASILIPLMVFMSIKPVIRVKDFARADQVRIAFTDPEKIPTVIWLPTDDDSDGIPLVWIADPAEATVDPEKGAEP